MHSISSLEIMLSETPEETVPCLFCFGSVSDELRSSSFVLYGLLLVVLVNIFGIGYQT